MLILATAALFLCALVAAQDNRVPNTRVENLFSVGAIATDMTFISPTQMLISSKDGRIFYARSNDGGNSWSRAGTVGNINGRIAMDGDRGLMSIAYHRSGWVYITYVRQTGGPIKNNQMSRVRWTGETIDWGSEQILFGRGCGVRLSCFC
jgi:hypothetical protein